MLGRRGHGHRILVPAEFHGNVLVLTPCPERLYLLCFRHREEDRKRIQFLPSRAGRSQGQVQYRRLAGTFSNSELTLLADHDLLDQLVRHSNRIIYVIIPLLRRICYSMHERDNDCFDKAVAIIRMRIFQEKCSRKQPPNSALPGHNYGCVHCH